MQGTPPITCTGLSACTCEPDRSDAAAPPPTTCTTSPAFMVNVVVPPAAVAVTPVPATICPVEETFTFTVVLACVAVIEK
jgi:hypothetical protein